MANLPSIRDPELDGFRATLDGIHVVHGLRTLCIAVVVAICALVGRAHASCAISLEGDPALIEQLRAELALFGDDGAPCLTLWIQVQQTSDHVEIDLHDDLGRSTMRLFSSPGGAAAFIISWSRRPLIAVATAGPPPAARPDAPPGLVAAPPPASAGPRESGVRVELAVGYRSAAGSHPHWVVSDLSALWQASIWHYGATLHTITGPAGGHVATEAAIQFGSAYPLASGLVLRGELVAANTLVGRFGSRAEDVDYAATGMRIGPHVAMLWPIAAQFSIELGGGYDLVHLADSSNWGFRYIDVGMRWTL